MTNFHFNHKTGIPRDIWLMCLLLLSVSGPLISQAFAGPYLRNEELIARLNAPEAKIRAQMAQDIGNRSIQDRSIRIAIPQLTGLLGDPDAYVRNRAADAIGKLGPSAVPIQGLTKLTTDPDEDVRDRAAWALGEMKEEAISALPAMLAMLSPDESHAVRSEAAFAFGNIGPGAKDALPALLNAALRDPDAATRSNATESLMKIDIEDKTVSADLRKHLGDKDKTVRANAASALKLVGRIKSHRKFKLF
jgi:HEAT repeat protein